MSRVPSEFALFSADHKTAMCEGIAKDTVDDAVGDKCGFIIVSAYQAYTQFYRGLSEELGKWMYQKMDKDL